MLVYQRRIWNRDFCTSSLYKDHFECFESRYKLIAIVTTSKDQNIRKTDNASEVLILSNTDAILQVYPETSERGSPKLELGLSRINIISKLSFTG